MCICPFYPADIADVHASLIASPWPDGPGLISGDVAPTSWIADDGTPADAYQTCDQEKGIDEQSRERGSPAGERRLHRHRRRRPRAGRPGTDDQPEIPGAAARAPSGPRPRVAAA